MILVFDTNVVVEAIFWPRSTAWLASTGPALRRFKRALKEAILEEYAAITAELRAKLFPDAQPSGALAWLAAKSIWVEPMLLHGKLSRDPDDNLFVATEAAVHATFHVTLAFPSVRPSFSAITR